MVDHLAGPRLASINGSLSEAHLSADALVWRLPRVDYSLVYDYDTCVLSVGGGAVDA